MRAMALIIWIACSLSVWAEFTSPPWPSGTNYYIAGTNKDNRARQIEQAINEREIVLGITNSPLHQPSFYVYERANVVLAKAWIDQNVALFVDQTRTSQGNIVYWNKTNLLADRGLPTNFLAYTPWQSLNGVGYGYTNSNTAAGFTTLHYGSAGLTNIFKVLTHVARVGTWVVSTNGNSWGRGWAFNPPAFAFNAGYATHKDTADGDVGSGMLSFFTTLGGAVTACNEAWLGDFTTSNEVWTWSTFEDASIGADAGQDIAPRVETRLLVVSNDYTAFGYNADYIVTSGHKYHELPSAALPAWKLYVQVGGPSDIGATLNAITNTFYGYGVVSSQEWSVVSTGIVNAGTVLLTPLIGFTNTTLSDADFPTNLYAWAGFEGEILGAGVAPDEWYGDLSEDSFSRVRAMGFQIVDSVLILDYGATNGFIRK